MKIKAVFLLSLICLSQHFNFVRVTVKLVWCFENDWKSFKLGVVYNLYHCFKAKTALADFFVSVLVTLKRVLAVVHVYCFKAVKSQYSIKLIKHAVKVIYNVIAGIVYMSGVKANTELFVKLHTVNNCL